MIRAGGAQTKVEVNQLAIEPTIAPNAAMVKLLVDFTAPIKR